MKKIKYLKKSLRGPHYYRRQIPLTGGGYHHVYEPIPYEFGTPEFFTEYARINEKFEKGNAHVPLDVVPKKALHALIADFLGSTEFNRDIGARTRKEYEDGLADIKSEWTDVPVKSIERPNVLIFRDRMAKKWAPSRVNKNIKSLCRLLSFGMDRGYGLNHNPAVKIPNLEMGDGEGWRPWEPESIQVAMSDFEGIARTAFYLAYFTGQRDADIRKMRWADIAGEEVRVIQEKTGAEVWVPLHPDLQTELAGTERRGETIIAAELLRSDGLPSRTAGQSLSKAALEKYWQPERRRFGLNGVDKHNTRHGLRKNATINLLEAGCTNCEAKAITGHSTDQMVNHYAKKVNQRRQARAAMDKVVQFKKAASENG
jgi:integrase